MEYYVKVDSQNKIILMRSLFVIILSLYFQKINLLQQLLKKTFKINLSLIIKKKILIIFMNTTMTESKIKII